MTHAFRFSFYTLLMLALYTLDSGAGITRALKDVREAQHRSHTGVL